MFRTRLLSTSFAVGGALSSDEPKTKGSCRQCPSSHPEKGHWAPCIIDRPRPTPPPPKGGSAESIYRWDVSDVDPDGELVPGSWKLNQLVPVAENKIACGAANQFVPREAPGPEKAGCKGISWLPSIVAEPLRPAALRIVIAQVDPVIDRRF